MCQTKRRLANSIKNKIIQRTLPKLLAAKHKINKRSAFTFRLNGKMLIDYEEKSG